MIDVKLLKGDAIAQYTWGWIHETMSVGPREYLAFAQQDRSDGTSARHLINSVSNSKRALHRRMENLYNGFGGIALAGKASNFPSLIGFLRKCGIVSPCILDRLNKLRNAVEHHYYTPTLDEADTLLDTTELFLVATDPLLARQPSVIEFEHDTIRDQSGRFLLQEISFDWKTAQVTFSFSPEGNTSLAARIPYLLDSGKDDYFECVQFAIKHSE